MNGLGELSLMFFSVWFGPPAIFAIIGLVKRKSDPAAAKGFFIFAVVWVLIGGGICLSLL